MNAKFHCLLEEVDKILKRNTTLKKKLQQICNLLNYQIAHYDWVGFYFADNSSSTLWLSAYCGEPTEHTVIPFGKGICGQVANSNTNFVVSDVGSQDNYIACSLDVKSEIVIPLFVNEENIAQIDIDSHTINAFTEEDERFLEQVNQKIALLFEKDVAKLDRFLTNKGSE